MLSPLLVEYDNNIKSLKEQVKTYKVLQFGQGKFIFKAAYLSLYSRYLLLTE